MRTSKKICASILCLVLVAGCASSGGTTDQTTVIAPSTTLSSTSISPTSSRFVAEIWADNWFSLWINGTKVGEDSVPITTERSFNSESIRFEADYPLTVAIVSKDFIENDSGLEYIGQPNQQIGDGGFITQITDLTTGKVVLTTSAQWRGLVVHTAPLNPECESSSSPTVDCRHEIVGEPDNWQSADFDTSTWAPATEYSEAEVGTKDGYNDINWDQRARLIWGSDLKLQNTILWRAPTVKP